MLLFSQKVIYERSILALEEQSSTDNAPINLLLPFHICWCFPGDGRVSNSDGLQPTRDGLQPKSKLH